MVEWKYTTAANGALFVAPNGIYKILKSFAVSWVLLVRLGFV